MRKIKTSLLGVFAVALALSVDTARAAEIEVASVLVKLIEQADAPSRDAGILAKVDVREGDIVHTGDIVGQLDATAATIDFKHAIQELEAAKIQSESDV